MAGQHRRIPFFTAEVMRNRPFGYETQLYRLDKFVRKWSQEDGVTKTANKQFLISADRRRALFVGHVTDSLVPEAKMVTPFQYYRLVKELMTDNEEVNESFAITQHRHHVISSDEMKCSF